MVLVVVVLVPLSKLPCSSGSRSHRSEQWVSCIKVNCDGHYPDGWKKVYSCLEDLPVITLVLSRHIDKERWYLFLAVICCNKVMDTKKLSKGLFDDLEYCINEPILGMRQSLIILHVMKKPSSRKSSVNSILYTAFRFFGIWIPLTACHHVISMVRCFRNDAVYNWGCFCSNSCMWKSHLIVLCWYIWYLERWKIHTRQWRHRRIKSVSLLWRAWPPGWIHVMVQAYTLHTASQCQVHFSQPFNTTPRKWLKNITYAGIYESHQTGCPSWWGLTSCWHLRHG